MTAPAALPETDSLDRRLWRLAWPLMVSSSLWNVQVAVDRMMLGWYGEGTAAAALAASMLFWTALAPFQATVLYTTTFVAQYQGAGRADRVGPAVWQGIWLALFSGAILFLVLVPLVPSIIVFAGHEPQLQAHEEVYLRWLTLAAVPFLLLAAANSFFAGRGESLVVMVADVIGVIVNLSVGSVLIFGYLGFPRMGVAGAGIAVLVGNSCAALFSLAMLFRHRYETEFKVRSGWKIDFRLLGRVLYFGVPSGLFMAVDAMAWTCFVVFVGQMGQRELTLTMIAFTLNLFAYLPAVGLGQAVGILVGQAQGKGDSDEAASVTRRGLGYAMLINGTVSLLFLVVPLQLAALFHDPGATEGVTWADVAVTVPLLLRFVVVYVLFDTLNLVVSHALRGAGDTRFVSLLPLVLVWPLLVVPTYLAVKFHLGLFVPWAFASLFVIVLAIGFWWRFKGGRWRSMRVIEEAIVEEQTANPAEQSLASGPLVVVSSTVAGAGEAARHRPSDDRISEARHP